MIPKVQLTSKGAALLAKVPAGEAVPGGRSVRGRCPRVRAWIGRHWSCHTTISR